MGVNIFETIGTTGLNANKDKHAGFIIKLSDIPAGLVEDKVNFLTSINDLKKIEIFADSTNVDYKLLFYHADMFFKANPLGVLHLVPTLAFTTDLFDEFEEYIQLVGYTTNEQVADSTALIALVNSLQVKRDSLLLERNHCMQIIVSAGVDLIALYTSLPSFEAAGTADFVALDLAQDYSDNSLAKEIFDEKQLCGSIGLMLGIATKNTVKDHIGYRAINTLGRYGISRAILPTGDKKDVKELSKTVKQQLKDKGLIFIEKIETSGDFAYHNARNCTKISSDRLEFNTTRPENKAKRIIDLAVTNRVNQDYFTSTGGKLSKIEISSLKVAIITSLQINMMQGSFDTYELDYEDGNIPLEDIYINPDQNVKVTGKIDIVSKLRFKSVVSVINIYSTINLK